MESELYYPDSPLPKTLLEKKYALSEEIVQILTEWASKNHFELEPPPQRTSKIAKEEKHLSRLTALSSSSYATPKKAPEDSKWKVLEQDCSKNEGAHNHSLALEEFQLLPKAKRALVGSDTADMVQKMINAGNSVPEIRKTIDETDGKSIWTYDDIRNWKVEVERHEKGMDVAKSNASDLIRRMESKDYIVRHQASSDGKNVRSIFFMHSNAVNEINARGEVFAIDATYSVNNKAMPK